MSKEQLSVGNSIKALALINIQDIFRFTITAKDEEIRERVWFGRIGGMCCGKVSRHCAQGGDVGRRSCGVEHELHNAD